MGSYAARPRAHPIGFGANRARGAWRPGSGAIDRRRRHAGGGAGHAGGDLRARRAAPGDRRRRHGRAAAFRGAVAGRVPTDHGGQLFRHPASGARGGAGDAAGWRRSHRHGRVGDRPARSVRLYLLRAVQVRRARPGRGVAERAGAGRRRGIRGLPARHGYARLSRGGPHPARRQQPAGGHGRAHDGGSGRGGDPARHRAEALRHRAGAVDADPGQRAQPRRPAAAPVLVRSADRARLHRPPSTSTAAKTKRP